MEYVYQLMELLRITQKYHTNAEGEYKVELQRRSLAMMEQINGYLADIHEDRNAPTEGNSTAGGRLIPRDIVREEACSIGFE